MLVRKTRLYVAQMYTSTVYCGAVNKLYLSNLLFILQLNFLQLLDWPLGPAIQMHHYSSEQLDVPASYDLLSHKLKKE